MSKNDPQTGAPIAPVPVDDDHIDGHAGAEVARLLTELGALTTSLAEGRGSAKLTDETRRFVSGQKVLSASACRSCADRLRRDAFADAVIPQTIERPVRDRRSDFLLRMVVAFYPYGIVDAVHGHHGHGAGTVNAQGHGQDLALPRHVFGRLGQFLRSVLGTLPYADLNADCSRLLSRFPGVADRNLRDAVFAHPPSRVLLMKILIRLLTGFEDLDSVRSAFMKEVSSKSWPNIFDASANHFNALCDGLFGEFTLQLQSPREGDDLDSWFGFGATIRVLDMLEHLVDQQAA